MFFNCAYTREVWVMIRNWFKETSLWVEDTFKNSLHKLFCYRSLKVWSSLPFIVSWCIWKSCNKALFFDMDTPTWVVSMWIEVGYNDHYFVVCPKRPREIGNLVLDKNTPWAFFDGAY